jgi:hypothetical protein
VPEVLAAAEPKERRRFLFGWSVRRQANQAVAARCRAAQRAARQALGAEEPLKAAAIPPEEAKLTDEQWASVRDLLPAQRGSIGRPPLDHRVVLGGILWVARTGSLWREMPEEYGKWETAYRRHELWVEQDLWWRILRALGEEDVPGPATKNGK